MWSPNLGSMSLVGAIAKHALNDTLNYFAALLTVRRMRSKNAARRNCTFASNSGFALLVPPSSSHGSSDLHTHLCLRNTVHVQKAQRD